MAIAYPIQIPLEELRNVIAMLTGNKAADRAVIAKSVWVVTGYVLKLTVGEVTDGAALFVESTAHAAGIIPARAEYSGGTKAVGQSYSSVYLTDQEAAALLSTLAAVEASQADGVAHANFLGGEILTGIISSDFIKSQIAKILLPFLLNKLKEWIASGGLDSFLGNLIKQDVVKAQSFSVTGGCCKKE